MLYKLFFYWPSLFWSLKPFRLRRFQVVSDHQRRFHQGDLIISGGCTLQRQWIRCYLSSLCCWQRPLSNFARYRTLWMGTKCASFNFCQNDIMAILIHGLLGFVFALMHRHACIHLCSKLYCQCMHVLFAIANLCATPLLASQLSSGICFPLELFRHPCWLRWLLHVRQRPAFRPTEI